MREIVGDYARYNRIYVDSGACRFHCGDIHNAWDRPEAMRESHTTPYSVQMQSMELYNNYITLASKKYIEIEF